ncbi:DNA translocase FtsK [Aliarcobacter cryaerophilus]|uniref:DNA translocase FtsK n=2 Tax=unclassified Arcobacter TaxID=2593671 RepID=A0AA96HZW2_9BACT|nr:DNA translocase FtsK [Arcobacter sp. AZ-2023]WPD09791.1 DNA translocase FtsK [Arcobacter sp. DSM 115954]WNL14621.1 DNA translocase FtsK [Arcobacter sp. AZ-2023]WNL19496.1 DNA translocase FtsK [Arcobacter sp. AZ-2023]WNL21635.1 DNA translocase FtsK [Arcobacter sp. AZ-2023]
MENTIIVDKETYKEVVKFINKENKCSISLLQRVFRLQYNVSSNIVKQLESDKLIAFEIDGKIRVL